MRQYIMIRSTYWFDVHFIRQGSHLVIPCIARPFHLLSFRFLVIRCWFGIRLVRLCSCLCTCCILRSRLLLILLVAHGWLITICWLVRLSTLTFCVLWRVQMVLLAANFGVVSCGRAPVWAKSGESKRQRPNLELKANGRRTHADGDVTKRKDSTDG